MTIMQNCAFRLLTSAEFEVFQNTGVFEGSPKDASAGFIHLSTFEQLERRIDRYVDASGQIFALCVNLEPVEADVRWEVAHDGDFYPHLYRPITSDFATPTELSVSDMSVLG